MTTDYSSKVLKGEVEKINNIKDDKFEALYKYEEKLKACKKQFEQFAKELCNPFNPITDAPLERNFQEYYQEAISLRNAFNAVKKVYDNRIDAAIIAGALSDMINCVDDNSDTIYHGHYHINGREVFDYLLSILPKGHFLEGISYGGISGTISIDFSMAYMLFNPNTVLEIQLAEVKKEESQFELYTKLFKSEAPFSLQYSPRYGSGDLVPIVIVSDEPRNIDFRFGAKEDLSQHYGKELVYLIGTVDLSNIPKQIEDKYLGDSTRVRKPFSITKID